jgi:hypothetical protein
VDFVEGEKILGTSQDRPFELNWQDPAPGRHEIVAQVSSGDGGKLVSAPVACYAGIPAFERTVKSSADISAELNNGPVNFAYQLLDIAAGTIGIRFNKLDVPRGAHIGNAYLEFTAAEPATQPTVLEIQAELSGNAPAFRPQDGNLTHRDRTNETVRWEPKPWIAAGDRDRTPDLAPLLEEVVAHAEWQPGNAVVFLIHGWGRRVARAPDEDSRRAPELYVELQLSHMAASQLR